METLFVLTLCYEPKLPTRAQEFDVVLRSCETQLWIGLVFSYIILVSVLFLYVVEGNEFTCSFWVLFATKTYFFQFFGFVRDVPLKVSRAIARCKVHDRTITLTPQS